MLRALILVVAVSLIYWLFKMKKQGIFRSRRPQNDLPVTSIEGHELRTFLDIDTPLECLRDDGVRYGQSFRLKNMPPIPHNQQCRCQTVPLSYTSSEVFQGALRDKSPRQTTLGELEAHDAQLLKSMLMGLHIHPLPIDFDTFCQQFDLSKVSEDYQSQILELVKKGFEKHQQSSTALLKTLPSDEKENT